MQTTENIDYKKLYEQEVIKVVSLNHELANLKRLLFGSRQERFVLGQNLEHALNLRSLMSLLTKLSWSLEKKECPHSTQIFELATKIHRRPIQP